MAGYSRSWWMKNERGIPFGCSITQRVTEGGTYARKEVYTN